MADPMDTTLPKTDTPVSDPQAMVDAALGNVSAPPITPDPTPTPEPVVESPSQVDQLPPLSPPSVSEPVAPTPVLDPTLVAQPAMPVMPSPAMGNVTMGDDTPLAFATPPSMTTTPSNNPIPNPSALGTSVPMDSIPPAPLSPLEPAKPKKKSKMGLVIGGILLLVLGVGGGLWGYNRYTTTQAQVALVNALEEDELKFLKKSVAVDKKIPIKQDDGTYKVPKKPSDVKDKDLDQIRIPAITLQEAKTAVQTAIEKGGYDEGEKCLAGYTGLCMNGSGSCVSGTCMPLGKLTQADCTRFWGEAGKMAGRSSDNPCNSSGCTLTKELADAKCIVQNVKCAGGGQSGVACEDNIVYTGNQTNDSASIDNAACGSQQIDVICPELCGTTKPISFSSRITGTNCGGAKTSTTTTTNTDNPTHKVCNTTTFQCQTVDGAGADTCTTDANCVVTAPTMACTSLTSAPSVATPPIVGSKVTFTCLGSVTPSTAGTLTYKFRYSLNSAAVIAMTNKTPTTAELNIAACGSYKVECQACTTLNGVAKCDPIWTGATQ